MASQEVYACASEAIKKVIYDLYSKSSDAINVQKRLKFK